MDFATLFGILGGFGLVLPPFWLTARAAPFF
jgi:hypothetical protein